MFGSGTVLKRFCQSSTRPAIKTICHSGSFHVLCKSKECWRFFKHYNHVQFENVQLKLWVFFLINVGLNIGMSVNIVILSNLCITPSPGTIKENPRWSHDCMQTLQCYVGDSAACTHNCANIYHVACDFFKFLPLFFYPLNSESTLDGSLEVQLWTQCACQLSLSMTQKPWKYFKGLSLWMSAWVVLRWLLRLWAGFH